MKTIVCFGDSNTWGYIPITGHRLPKDKRWTGIMSELLGHDYNVCEQGVNGRTTCFDDPIYPLRQGTGFFEEVLLTDYPVDLVIIMLGTNDSKIHLRQTSFSISVGMERLIKIAKDPQYGPNYGKDSIPPKVLVVAPAHLDRDIISSPFSNDFNLESARIVEELAPLYKELAERYDCAFLDAAEYTKASKLDCIHITEESHMHLAQAIANKVKELID